jgi:hypothetical protein
LRAIMEIVPCGRFQGCSTLYSMVSGFGESKMPHTDPKHAVIVESGFPRRGAV